MATMPSWVAIPPPTQNITEVSQATINPVIQHPVPVQRIFPSSISLGMSIGEPTLLLESAYAFTFYINSVDRSTNILAARNPLSIHFQQGSRGSATLQVYSANGSYRPQTLQEVHIYQNETGERIFGGLITTIEETGYKGLSAHEVKVVCGDYGTLLDRAIVEAYFPPGVIIYSPKTMIIDILNVYVPELGISVSPFSADGSLITTEKIFPHITATQAIQQILDPDGLDFFVDQYKMLHIISRTAGYGAAPFNIADNDGNVQANSINVRQDATKYTNRVGIRADFRQPALWHEIFIGDGVNRGFTTKYVIDLPGPLIFVNGVAKSVQAYNAYAIGGADFSYGPGGYGIFSNPYQPPYTSSDTIDVYYPGKIQPIVYAKDDALIAADGMVLTTIIDVKDVVDQDELLFLAQGYLDRLKIKPYFVDYETLRHGLLPGQLQNINYTNPLVPNVDTVITSITGTCGGRKTLAEELGPGKKAYFKWRVSTTNAQAQGQRTPEQQLLEFRRTRVQAQDRHRVTLVIDLYEDIPGLTNPGLQVGETPSSRELDKPGFLKIIKVRFEDNPPQVNLCQFDVLYAPVSTGIYVSVFANGELLEVDINDTATIAKYSFTSWPFPVGIGDRFKGEIVTADDTAKNGKIEIEIQG